MAENEQSEEQYTKINVTRIDELESVGPLGTDDGLRPSDKLVISRETNSSAMSKLIRAANVSIQDIASFVADHIKKNKIISMNDIEDGETIMTNVQETMNAISQNGIDNFSNNIYAKRITPSFTYDDQTSAWSSEEITFTDDCSTYIHANLPTLSSFNPKFQNDSVVLQIYTNNDWFDICSEPKTSTSCIIEIDYHANVQAGTKMRFITRANADQSALSGIASFANPSIVVSMFSNDKPFMSKAFSEYLFLGSSNNLSNDVSSEAVEIKDVGLVGFGGNYAQMTDISSSTNWNILRNHPWHTSTVYAKTVDGNGNQITLGSTEDSITAKQKSVGKFNFNNLYYYVSADAQNPLSVYMYADTPLYDSDKITRQGSQFNPTKMQFYGVDEISTILGTDDYQVSSLSDISAAFSDDSLDRIKFIYDGFLGVPGLNYFKSGSTASKLSANQQGSERMSWACASIQTNSDRPFYMMETVEPNSVPGPEVYSLGSAPDGMAVNTVVKNLEIPLTTNYGNSIPSSLTSLQDALSTGAFGEAYTEVTDFADALSADGVNRLEQWGHTHFERWVLSDNVAAVGVYSDQLDDYSTSPVTISTLVRNNPVRYAGDMSMNLAGIKLPDTELTVKHSAFAFCQNLSSIQIPSNVKFDGRYTFRMGAAYSKMPSALISAAPYSSYMQLSRIKLSTNASSVNCDSISEVQASLLSSVQFGDGVELANEDKTLLNTFVNCSRLTNANIEKTDAKALKGTFINCENLSSVTIPMGCEVIDVNSFAGCHKLRKITIPTSVTAVMDSAADYSFFDVGRLSDTQWFHLTSMSSSVTNVSDTLNTKLSDVISTNGNYGISSVYGTQHPENDDKLYEIDIQLQNEYSQYTPTTIKAEISSTINALNKFSKTPSLIAGIIQYPSVRKTPSGSNRRYDYTPPRGNIYHIVDRNGSKMVDNNNNALVYDSMKNIRETPIYINQNVSMNVNYQYWMNGSWYNSNDYYAVLKVHCGDLEFNEDFIVAENDISATTETNKFVF